LNFKDFIPTVIETLEKASVKIMAIYAQDFDVEIKDDNSPVTIADKKSSEIILKGLSDIGIPIISEEEEKMPYKERKDLPYLWLVDPLDGTKEFIKKNDEFCICTALIHNHQPVLGFIASPTEEKILIGGKGLPAFEIPYGEKDIYNKRWMVSPNINIKKERKALAHSRAPFSGTSLKFVRQLEEKYGKLNIIKKGSALKFFDLVKGHADFYTRLAPTMEWDIAAGHAIYESVGGEVIHFHTKEPLIYNKPSLKNPYFLAKLKSTKI
jgi:3'(2'), 5'-bisphosphate nucleotidase